MKNAHKVKLSLRRETLRRLDSLSAAQLRGVAGGDTGKQLLSRGCTLTTTDACDGTSACDQTYTCVDR